jgi:hypothetical protein
VPLRCASADQDGAVKALMLLWVLSEEVLVILGMRFAWRQALWEGAREMNPVGGHTRGGGATPRRRQGEAAMARIEIDTPAPDFALADFRGQLFRLSDHRGRHNVLLVFNRGFT